MRNTTVHLPELYLKLIDEIISEKEYPCLSEFVRIAIRKMIKKDMKLLSNPMLEESSEDVKKIALKEKMNIQKKLEQCKILSQLNSAQMNDKCEIEKPKRNRQERVDKLWQI